jgi:hypothetical protein
VSLALASVMRSRSIDRRSKRRGASETIIIVWTPSRSWQRGQFWNGERAAVRAIVKRQLGQVRWDNELS